MTDLSDFDFNLPADRIAAEPARPRDAARLLHVSASGITDRVVRDLPGLLRGGDLLVVNDTRVIPAQLRARRGQARIGLTLDRPLAHGGWVALARNARRLRPGDTVAIEGPVPFTATIRARHPDGSVVLDFDRAGEALDAALRAAGRLALPPYIPRPEGPTARDASDYQTMFAEHEGAVAAPTAGLHMTPEVTAALAARGIGLARITLHVGAGTFLPLREGSLAKRRLHPERGTIAPEAAATINAAREAGGRIVALGTTTLRLLESAVDEAGRIHPFAGETDIMLAPGHEFRSADLLLTNFHLPKSSLFMLVCAFAGTARMRAAYAHAIAAGYRFYSYGDATLLDCAHLGAALVRAA
jgi:S-adenosylmethionine:tRNA ribosyltransferase-isomerase